MKKESGGLRSHLFLYPGRSPASSLGLSVLTCMTGMQDPVWDISDAGGDGGCFMSPTPLCVDDTEAGGIDASLPH